MVLCERHAHAISSDSEWRTRVFCRQKEGNTSFMMKLSDRHARLESRTPSVVPSRLGVPMRRNRYPFVFHTIDVNVLCFPVYDSYLECCSRFIDLLLFSLGQVSLLLGDCLLLHIDA